MTHTRTSLRLLVLLVLFAAVAVLFPRAAHAAPTLLAPDAVVKGQEFEARIENAPRNAMAQWTWDRGRLRLIESSNDAARFEAILDGKGWIEARIGNWRQKVTVVITREGTVKPPPPTGETVKDPKLESSRLLLEQFRSGQINATQFFQNMGNEGLSVKDLVAYKAHVIEQERLRLIREGGYPATEAIRMSQVLWAREYAPYERDLMHARQQGVNTAWENALTRYIELHPDLPYVGAKMDVGGWATETKADMRFEGDIDFSIIMVDVEDAKQLRNLFEQEIKRMFNLNMIDIDALGTAHRAATESVYIGDYGAKWAEIDAIRRGKMYKLKNVTGKVEKTLMTEDEKIVMLAVLENREHVKKTGVDILDQILAEGGPVPKASMEPGVSLEFLRHVTVDAIRSRLSILEKIVKISKYVNRSASDHAKFLEKVPGFTLEPKDVPLVKGVQAITDVKQDRALTPDQKIIWTMGLATALMGEGWANDPNAALERLGQRATALISHNIAEGIKAREKLIGEGNKTKQERDAERKQLLDDLQNEFKVFEDVGVPFPEAARAKMVELQNYFKRTFVLPADEMKKIDEIMKRAAENPNMLKIYAASVWEKMVKLHKTTDEAIDGFNTMIDFMDNATVQHLRTLGDEVSFMDGKVTLKLPINIGRINQDLNKGVLGKIGQSTTFKAFNLGQEGLAYYEAVMGGADWNESFTNLATELFRRRVPAGGAVEAGMQGNYLYAGIQVVYLIFPPLAIPEGLYGMAASMAEWGVGAMNQWRYDAMVEMLYTGATFQKEGAAWNMTGLSYNCPPLIELSIDKGAKTKDGLYKLLDSCAKVSSILYPQVKQHPTLLQFEDMLGNSAVSSGKTSIMGMNSGWPYQYTGLSRYGEELYMIYLKKVDAVTLEYYKGVIDGLEKRKAWDSGTGYSQIVAIEKELGCTAPLVQYTVGYLGGDAIKSDAERFQAIVDSYKRLKAANKEIADIGEKWQAGFLNGLAPQCTPESIDKTEKEAKGLLGRLQQAVEAARKEVVAFVGNNPTDEDLAPPTRARLCMTVNDRASEPYRRCYEDHKAALDKLAEKAVDLTVAVVAADEVCVAQKISLAVNYNKPCPECAIVGFEILDESGSVEERITPAGAKTPWTPGTTGRKTIRANVDLTVIKDVLKVQRKGEKPVTVKGEADCPRLKVALDADGVTEIGKDGQLTLTARPVSLAPGNPPISRYFWKEDGVDKPASAEPTYLLSGKGKGDRTVNVTVVARDAEQNLSEPAGIDIRITVTATAAIPVSVRPVDLPAGPDGTFSIKDDATVTLKATPTPKTDSGRLRFQWSADGKLIDPDRTHTDSTIFKGEGWSGKTVTIALVVMDEKNREGKGSISINVLPSKGLGVSFEDHPKIVTERDVLKIRVKEPPKGSGNYRYTWTRQGISIKSFEKTTFDFLDAEFQGLAGKTLTIRVDVYDDAGRAGFAETSIAVTEPKPEEEKIPVEIRSDRETIDEDGATDLTAFATPYADSGKLTYFWAESPQGAPNNVFRMEGKGHRDVTVTVTVVVKDERGRTGEQTKSIYVKKKGTDAAPVVTEGKKDPAPGDPKQQAEAKYRWLKESVAYLEVLKEFDRKSYIAFEKSVTSSIVREFVSKAPPRYDKEFKLPDGPDKALCGETFGDIRDRLRGYESECWSTSNAGCKTVGTREVTRTVDGKQIKFAESISSCDIPCGKAQTCSNVLKTYSGQLGYANDLQDYVNEKQLGCLGEAGAANGKHQRELDKKIKELPESLPYKRFQEFAGLNDWKGYLAAVEKTKQEFGLPEPIPSPIVLPWSYTSPCGGKGAAPELAGPLQVTLNADKKKLKPGELASITAAVTGGKPDYTYNWTGNYAGTGSKVTVTSRNPGKQTLSLVVSDTAGSKGQASIEIEVEGLKAAINGLKDKVVYGTTLVLTASFEAIKDAASSASMPEGYGERPPPWNEEKIAAEAKRVHKETWDRLTAACDKKVPQGITTKQWNSDAYREARMEYRACGDDAMKQASKAMNCVYFPKYEECGGPGYSVPGTKITGYRVIWQSDPGITFDPATSDGTTTVLFDRMPSSGKIKIWAEIQKDGGGGVYSTVGETPQQEVTVVPPKFKWTFNPEKGKGRIGQEVRATLTTEPADIKPELLNYEWSWPESSGRMEYEKNASIIGFVSKDAKPVKLLVAPKTPFYRENIGGGLLEEYQAQGFNVTVTGPKQMGPTPQVWKEKVGLVDVQREIAVFQNVFMRAEVAPDPEKKPLRYQWTVTPGGCTVGNEVSQEPTVNCSETGSYQAKVTVKDRDGVELGSGAGTISVTISQNEITKAKDKKKELEEKLAKAQALEREGKYDEAIGLTEETLKIDPKHDGAKQLLARLKQEKGDADKKIAAINKDIGSAKFDEAERELKALKGRCPQYPPLLAAEKKLAAEREKAQGKAGAELAKVSEAVKARDFKQALTLAGEVRKTTKLNQKQDAELAGLERTARDQEAKKERARTLLRSAEAKLGKNDYDGALTDLAGGVAASQDLWSAKDPEPARFATLKTQTETKAKRLKELLPAIQQAAEGKPVPPAEELKKALASADEAKALQPTNERIATYRKLIEQRLAAGEKESEKIKAAKELRDRGEAAQKQGKIPEAISSFRESLKILPDPALEAHVKTLEARLAQDREKVETAKRLRAEGEALQSQGKTAEAVAKYRESLKYVPDARLEEHIKVLEAKLAGEAAKIETAKRLRAEGEALQSQGKTAEAVAKYRESLKYVPDAKLEEHIRVLEAQEARQVGQRKAADQFWQEGTALFNQGRPGEALAKFKESLGYGSDASRQKYVADLEARRTKAVALRDEGSTLQNQNRLSEAVAKYKESLTVWPDPGLSSHIATLEGKLKQDADTAARKAKAKQLRDEGYALQQRNQLQAAVGKYRESLAVWPDPQLEDYIRQLETKIASTSSIKTEPGPSSVLPRPGLYRIGSSGQTIELSVISPSSMRVRSWQTATPEPPESRSAFYNAGTATPLGDGVTWRAENRDVDGYCCGNNVDSEFRILSSTSFRFIRYRLWPLNSARPGAGDLWQPTGAEEFKWVGQAAEAPPAATPPVAPPAAGQVPLAGGGGKTLFSNTNVGSVSNGPTRATAFTLREPHVITRIQTYHWNGGRGATPGTIALRGSDGRTYGPWQAKGTPGQGGARNAYWECSPGVTLPAGTYTIVDSNPATWAQNSGSQGSGHTRVEGYPAAGVSVTAPAVTAGQAAAASSVTAEITNRSRENTHIFTEGESFGPGNRLAPGEKRKVAVTMKPDGSVTFKAGRNGQVMATKTWRGNPGDSSRVPVVVFDESNPYNKLTVTTGLR